MTPNKRWGDYDTIRFVELYEKAECLWNFQHNDYKNKKVRESAYQKIVQEMNIPGFDVTELKYKIKNIRSTYAQERLKLKKAGVQMNKSYTLKWFPIAERFLGRVVAVKSSTSTSSVEKKNTEEDVPKTETETDNSNNQIEVEVQNISQKSNCFKESKRKRKSETHSEIEEEIEKSQERNCSVKNKIDDEFYYFGNNVACQLRELPLQEALICQTKIMEILTQQRIASIKSRTSVH